MFGNFTEIIDVSRSLHSGMAIYPGDHGFELEALKRMPGDTADLSAISAGLHTGTHVDAPGHFLEGAERIDEVGLGKFMGEAEVLDFSDFEGQLLSEEVMKEKCEGKDLSGKIAVIKTRNSFSDPNVFDEEFVGLSGEAAEFLVGCGIKAVAVDGPSVDKFHSGGHNAHHALFNAGCVIFETLILDKVEEGPYFFIGLPLKIKDGEASMVRAILLR
ncbi:cyclase family protein [Candidatus Peregrinibacteria bacterium]|nr:cyclase family protein [Candidatus Peregrinibacteria bacterium]